jgi:DNA-binding NarL/FixJ family response regulator
VYRVLVVDDYEPWRRHIRSAIQTSPHWRIVGEAVDGVEAVQKAQALELDLILLDIGLPRLDGIQAARQILSLHRDSRILFVSEHQSPDIVDAALATAAGGYLLKSEAGRELFFAMDAVANGSCFISARLARSIDATASSQLSLK